MCIKKKPRIELEVGYYLCKKCGAVSSREKKVCKPKLIKKSLKRSLNWQDRLEPKKRLNSHPWVATCSCDSQQSIRLWPTPAETALLAHSLPS